MIMTELYDMVGESAHAETMRSDAAVERVKFITMETVRKSRYTGTVVRGPRSNKAVAPTTFLSTKSLQNPARAVSAAKRR